MTREIKKVAVIGAGAMGSGIAAQLANAGAEVYLLDKNPAAPQAAIQRMLKATPATEPMNAGFMSGANAKRIKTGTTDDNLQDAVKDADWIVEVIVEDLVMAMRFVLIAVMRVFEVLGRRVLEMHRLAGIGPEAGRDEHQP